MEVHGSRSRDPGPGDQAPAIKLSRRSSRQVAQVRPGVDVAGLVALRPAPRPGRARASRPVQRQAVRSSGRVGRRRAAARSSDQRQLRPTVRGRPGPRRRGPRRRQQPLDGRRGDARHVDGQHRDQVRGGEQRVATRSAAPATGPPYRGSSRMNVTGRSWAPGRRPRRPRPASTTASSARASRVRPAQLDARPCRRRRAGAAVPPASTTACVPHAAQSAGPVPATSARWRWTRHAGRHAGRPSSRRPPASTRPTTGRGCRADAGRQRPGGLPRGVRPRLRRGRLRRQRRTPSRSTARSPPRSPVAAEHGTTVVAGMFETADDPARPYNTLVAARRGARPLPQDPPLRLLRLPRVRPAHRRAARRRSVRGGRRASGSA